jgi:hypothetical protein
MELSWTLFGVAITFLKMRRRRRREYFILPRGELFHFLLIHRKSKCWKRGYWDRDGIGTDRLCYHFLHDRRLDVKTAMTQT